jgi:t-SNARE complex subunit (syntaxin)
MDRLAELKRATGSVAIDIETDNGKILTMFFLFTVSFTRIYLLPYNLQTLITYSLLLKLVVGLVPGAKSNDSSSSSNFMQAFFKDVELVKQNILVIQTSTRRISDINQQIILATSSEKEQDLSTDLGPTISETNKKAALTKALLQKLREETEKNKASSNCKQSEIRIRENLGNTLTRKFVDVMKEYQNAQTKYKTDIKKKVKRQVQIVKPDATTEEIDAVLQSGGSSEVFKQAILKGDASDAITNAYMNVRDKYQDVLTLEASVAELHQMFLDFALLIEQQGELLDQIAFQVQAAGDYIDEGNTEMTQAIEYQISIRKKQCCIVFTILIIIGIIVGIIIATQKK